MKRLTIGVLALLAYVSAASDAAVTKLRPEDRKILEDSSRFHTIRTTVALPKALVALCADDRGKMADPGQKWQVGCVGDGSLAMKRLVWAEVSGDFYVLHYESGGIGHGFHILVATCGSADAEPKVVWHGVGDGILRNYSAFMRALRRAELDDTLEYFL